MYLLALLFCKIWKKILRINQEFWGCAIFRPKIAHFSWKFFFWYKPLLLLSSTYWPFYLCKILKNSYSRSRVMRMHHFWTQNGPFAPNNFFLKIINIVLIYWLAPFIVQKFKRILLVGPELWGCTIFGLKMVHFSKWEFFQKTC